MFQSSENRHFGTYALAPKQMLKIYLLLFDVKCNTNPKIIGTTFYGFSSPEAPEDRQLHILGECPVHTKSRTCLS